MAREPIEPEDESDPEPLPTEELTDDSADEGALRERKRRLTRAEREARDFWLDVFASPVGRREMWKLLQDDMHAFTPQFPAGPVGFPDPNAAWYARGQQDMGLRLYQRWLEVAPEGLWRMHTENDPKFPKPKRRRYRTEPA